MRRRGRSSYLALDPVLLPLPSQTPLYSTTISKALRTALRGRAVANFVELCACELRRIPLPRTWVNKVNPHAFSATLSHERRLDAATRGHDREGPRTMRPRRVRCVGADVRLLRAWRRGPILGHRVLPVLRRRGLRRLAGGSVGRPDRAACALLCQRVRQQHRHLREPGQG